MMSKGIFTSVFFYIKRTREYQTYFLKRFSSFLKFLNYFKRVFYFAKDLKQHYFYSLMKIRGNGSNILLFFVLKLKQADGDALMMMIPMYRTIVLI